MRCALIGQHKTLRRNLRNLFKLATAADLTQGLQWYPTAHRIMVEWSATYGRSIATVACVTAAVSPQCEWSRNLIVADDILAERAVSVGGALHANIAKARRILADNAGNIVDYFPTGPKVASFALNLAGDFSRPTIDTHCHQAALDDVTVTAGLTPVRYAYIADAYIYVARETSLEPALFQSVIWHVWKRLYPKAKKNALRKQWHVVGMEE